MKEAAAHEAPVRQVRANGVVGMKYGEGGKERHGSQTAKRSRYLWVRSCALWVRLDKRSGE